jgi:hypothetical protein
LFCSFSGLVTTHSIRYFVNNTFSDSSSYIERKKALSIGKKAYKAPMTYNSYDPVNTYHTKRRVISAGTVSPKKKNVKK